MLHKATTFILVALLLAPLAGDRISANELCAAACDTFPGGCRHPQRPGQGPLQCRKDGVKQDYLAARGDEWVLLAEGFRPGIKKAEVHVFADFEGETYGDWQAVGEAFGPGPSLGATSPEQLLRGLQGRRLANSYAKSDKPVGKLVSPELTIRQPYLRFLIGGGNHPGGTCIYLVVDGKTVHQHVWFQHMNTPGAMVRELSAGEVRIGMDLLLMPMPPTAAAIRWRCSISGRGSAAIFPPPAAPGDALRRVRRRSVIRRDFLDQGYNVVGRQGLNHRQLPERPTAGVAAVGGRRPAGGRTAAVCAAVVQLHRESGWWNSGHATRCRSPGPCRGSFALRSHADKPYLDAAEAVADFSGLFQAVWAPEYIITAYPFGGLSSQLGDSEWLDQRAHRFADPFVRIGLLTGPRLDRTGHRRRTIFAHLGQPSPPPGHGIYTHTDFPVGLGPENIDHEGFPQRPLSSGPSWNTVGGLAGVAHVMDRLGGLYRLREELGRRCRRAEDRFLPTPGRYDPPEAGKPACRPAYALRPAVRGGTADRRLTGGRVHAAHQRPTAPARGRGGFGTCSFCCDSAAVTVDTLHSAANP